MPTIDNGRDAHVIEILTIEREYGCGAPHIAETLAADLHWKLWDHAITCEIAKRMKCDVDSVAEREERLDPTFHRLVKAFMRGSYEESFTGGGIELLDAEHLSVLFERVVTGIAERGNCVIVGRGAPYFLRGRPNAMHVFLYASRDEKIRRLIHSGKDESEAERLIETVDRERAAFIKKYYGTVWPQRDLYDLMVNTKIGDKRAIRAIHNHMTLINGTRKDEQS